MYGADISGSLAMVVAVAISPIPAVGLAFIFAVPQAGLTMALKSLLGIVAAGTVALVATAGTDDSASDEPASGIGRPTMVALGALLMLLSA